MGLFTACCNDSDEKPSHEYGDQPVGYLKPLLSWEDATDADSPIDDLRFTVSGSNGVTVTKNFTDVTTASSWLELLPAGEYDVLVTVNMDATHCYVLESAGTRSTTRAESFPDGSPVGKSKQQPFISTFLI